MCPYFILMLESKRVVEIKRIIRRKLWNRSKRDSSTRHSSISFMLILCWIVGRSRVHGPGPAWLVAARGEQSDHRGPL